MAAAVSVSSHETTYINGDDDVETTADARGWNEFTYDLGNPQ